MVSVGIPTIVLLKHRLRIEKNAVSANFKILRLNRVATLGTQNVPAIERKRIRKCCWWSQKPLDPLGLWWRKPLAS